MSPAVIEPVRVETGHADQIVSSSRRRVRRRWADTTTTSTTPSSTTTAAGSRPQALTGRSGSSRSRASRRTGPSRRSAGQSRSPRPPGAPRSTRACPPRRHDGPIHGLSWAHPSFGSILASCSFDGKVFIWKENEGGKGWSKVKEHLLHTASGPSRVTWPSTGLRADSSCPEPQSTPSRGHHTSSVRFLPAPARTARSPSSPSTVRESLVSCPSYAGSSLDSTDDGTWDASLFPAHPLGVTSVSWAPAVGVGSLTSIDAPENGQAPGITQVKRFASGGCDGLVRVWGWRCVSPRCGNRGRALTARLVAGTTPSRGLRIRCSRFWTDTSTGCATSRGRRALELGGHTSRVPDRCEILLRVGVGMSSQPVPRRTRWSTSGPSSPRAHLGQKRLSSPRRRRTRPLVGPRPATASLPTLCGASAGVSVGTYWPSRVVRNPCLRRRCITRLTSHPPLAGDGKVTLWKENLKGKFEEVSVSSDLLWSPLVRV